MARPLSSLASIFDGDVTSEKGIALTGFVDPRTGKTDTPQARPQLPKTGQRTSAVPRMSGAGVFSSPSPGQRQGVNGALGALSGQSTRPVPAGDRGEWTDVPLPSQGRTGASRVPLGGVSIQSPAEMAVGMGLVPQSLFQAQNQAAFGAASPGLPFEQQLMAALVGGGQGGGSGGGF